MAVHCHNGCEYYSLSDWTAQRLAEKDAEIERLRAAVSVDAQKQRAPESCPHCHDEDDCSHVALCNAVDATSDSERGSNEGS